jgi:hypothetical protein
MSVVPRRRSSKQTRRDAGYRTSDRYRTVGQSRKTRPSSFRPHRRIRRMTTLRRPKFRDGRCVPRQVRGIDAVKPDIRSADIPEAYEVIKVRRIPDEKAGVIPRRPDRVVAVHSVPSQVTEVYVIVDGGGDRRGLIDVDVDRHRHPRQDIGIVDADLVRVRICTVPKVSIPRQSRGLI